MAAGVLLALCCQGLKGIYLTPEPNDLKYPAHVCMIKPLSILNLVMAFALLQHRGKLLRVVPVKDGHVLEMHWDIPPTDQLYKEAPSQYLSHLLGHEGEGSAFALLKAKGWASSLSAGECG